MHGETHGKRWCLGIASRVDDVFSTISKFPTFLFQGFYTSLVINTYIYIYLIGGFNPSEKYVRQLGLLYPTERKNKIHVPSHQPNIYIYIIYIYQTSLKKGFTHYDVIGHVRTWPLISMNLPDFWGSPMKAENSETDHGYSLNMSIIYWI